MARPLKPAPHPWRKEDHNGKGIKIVAADGSTVCMMHYPKTTTESTNLELLLRAPILMERAKSLVTFCSALTIFDKPGKDNPTLVSMKALLDDIETIKVPKKEEPPKPEVL
jgi:hypothetical protein